VRAKVAQASLLVTLSVVDSSERPVDRSPPCVRTFSALAKWTATCGVTAPTIVAINTVQTEQRVSHANMRGDTHEHKGWIVD
jgi:hypothetical protein